MHIHDDRRCVLVGANDASILVGWEKRSASDVFETVEEQDGVIHVGCEDHGVGVIGDEAYFGVVVVVLSPGFRVDGSVFVPSVIVMTGVKVGSPVDGGHGLIFITTTREGSRGGNRGGSSTIAAAMRSSIDNDDRSGRDIMLDAPARIVRQMRLS